MARKKKNKTKVWTIQDVAKAAAQIAASIPPLAPPKVTANQQGIKINSISITLPDPNQVKQDIQFGSNPIMGTYDPTPMTMADEAKAEQEYLYCDNPSIEQIALAKLFNQEIKPECLDPNVSQDKFYTSLSFHLQEVINHNNHNFFYKMIIEQVNTAKAYKNMITIFDISLTLKEIKDDDVFNKNKSQFKTRIDYVF